LALSMSAASGRSRTPLPTRISEACRRAFVTALAKVRKEFDLLLALAQRPREVVTKRELLAEVWRQNYGGGDRTVDVHLSWLRRKLGETAADPRYLHSVRGVGIRLAAPDNGLDGH